MKIKITLSYDGTEFCGWQRQKNGRSVQQTLEEGIKKLTGENVAVVGSGRTDAGVHANGQVASFQTASDIPAENFAKAINTVLPKDLKVIKSERVADDFNALKNTRKKTYIYKTYISDVEKPLLERYAHRIYGNIDVEKMKTAAAMLVGEHDFKAFSATGGGAKTSTRRIYSLDITKKEQGLYFVITGNGFLYNMVRVIVGTLIKIGKGQTDAEVINAMLKSGKRELGGETVPAKGLCLWNVEY